MRHAFRALAGTGIALTLTAILSAAPDAGKHYWQLVVSYDNDGLEVLASDPIAPMQKAVRTPGLTGAPGRIDYTVEWLDAKGKTLATSATEFPLGQRVVMAEDAPCVPYIPAEDVLVIRLEGPDADKAPAAIRLTRGAAKRLASTDALPDAFDDASVQLELPAPIDYAKVAGPVGSAKIRDVGPDTNRIVIVVMGDGYTAANLSAGSFTTHASNLVNAFDGYPPWDEYLDAVNVYRVDVESNEAGADGDPTQATARDTYLNASFWTSNIERLLSIDATGRSRAIAAANAQVGPGVWDNIFVLVNSTKYGGAGGSISVSSVHPSSDLIILHEYGHTFAGLADEYESSYPGYPDGDGEPNVDFDASGPGLKWLPWVESGTPLPTPETATYANSVGTYEGARYRTTGIYRPWQNCGMRSLGPDFCPICKEAHIDEVHAIVSMIDGVTPAANSTVTVDSGGAAIQIDALGIGSLAYEWKLDGTPIPGADTATLNLLPGMMTADTQTLSVTISDDTPLVRLHTFEEMRSWTAERTAAAVGTDSLILY